MRQRFIQSFSTSGDIQTAIDGGQLGNPYVAYLLDEGMIDWNSKEATPIYSGIPLTFEIISAGTIDFSSYNNYTTCTVEYKTNDSDWVEVTTSMEGTAINVSAGDKVQIKGKTFISNYNTPLLFQKSTTIFNAYGNIMSLVSGSGFENLTVLTGDYAFYNLFSGCTGLVNAENLILPATTLTSHAYDKMFYSCSSLTTAPELPATNLVGFCYQSMFDGCQSLEKAPDLLASYVPNYGYYNMFENCRKLNYVKCMATGFGGIYSTRAWLKNVSSTGTFVKHPDATSWETGTFGANGIPQGWTVIDAVI